jgi:ABC-type phosphate/phosphonate transport system permease subunit
MGVAPGRSLQGQVASRNVGFWPSLATRRFRHSGAVPTYRNCFKYHETAACILVIIVLVWAADWMSGHLRKKIL